MVDSYGNEPMTDYDEDVDWENVGNPPPAHKFNVICESANHTFTKAGKHMIKAQFKIEGYDPEYPEDEKFIGRTLFTNFNFTAQGGFLTKAFCQVGNVELPRTINRAILEDWCSKAVGTQLAVLLKHRTWNDQLQADISKFMPLMSLSNEIDTSEESEVMEEPVEEVVVTPTRSLREATAKTNGHTPNGKKPPGKKEQPVHR